MDRQQRDSRVKRFQEILTNAGYQPQQIQMLWEGRPGSADFDSDADFEFAMTVVVEAFPPQTIQGFEPEDPADHLCLHCGKPAICDGSRDCQQFCSKECAQQNRKDLDELVRHLKEV